MPSGSKPCIEGCTCKRHSMRICEPDCTCGKHSIPKCEPGCTCNRHLTCEPGCTCSRHNGGSQFCPEGCTCKKHSKPTGATRSAESRKTMSEARIRYFENNPDARKKIAKQMHEYYQEHPEAYINFSKDGNPNFGKWTPEQIAKRVATRRARDNYPTIVQMANSLRKRKPTSIEIILKELLTERYPELEILDEFPFGKYYIYDFALPDINLFCEADGTYWHGFPDSQKRDKAKDTYARNRGWEVQRYSEVFLKEWKIGRG